MLNVRNFFFHKSLSFGRFIVYHILGVCVYGSIPVIVSMGHLNPYLPYLATSLHVGFLLGWVSLISTVLKNRKHSKSNVYLYYYVCIRLGWFSTNRIIYHRHYRWRNPLVHPSGNQSPIYLLNSLNLYLPYNN